MSSKKKALIIGCGWVGIRFAQKLITIDFDVTATTTSDFKINTLNHLGVRAFLLDFSKEPIPEMENSVSNQLFDIVLISVPAKKREDFINCIKKFEGLSQFLQKIRAKSMVYLSSVGIYPTSPHPIGEMDIPNQLLDPKLYRAEQILTTAVAQLNILRLGGIFGDNRIPGRHFSAKRCEVGSQFANYIHVEDIHAIILSLYDEGIHGKLYNAVSPFHPQKKEIILQMVKKYGFALPSSFENRPFEHKLVSSEKLITDLNYQFIYESPLDY